MATALKRSISDQPSHACFQKLDCFFTVPLDLSQSLDNLLLVLLSLFLDFSAQRRKTQNRKFTQPLSYSRIFRRPPNLSFLANSSFWVGVIWIGALARGREGLTSSSLHPTAPTFQQAATQHSHYKADSAILSKSTQKRVTEFEGPNPTQLSSAVVHPQCSPQFCSTKTFPWGGLCGCQPPKAG